MSNKNLANALRFLAIDAVEQANSGHPGMPMGMADVASVLFNEFLKFNPKNMMKNKLIQCCQNLKTESDLALYV